MLALLWSMSSLPVSSSSISPDRIVRYAAGSRASTLVSPPAKPP
jgi:hypothetical protein